MSNHGENFELIDWILLIVLCLIGILMFFGIESIFYNWQQLVYTIK